MNTSNNSNNKDNQNTQTVEDPIDNSQRVLVRNTVTGFEQGIAAVTGFLTSGPIGALASWGIIRGVQGKWTPWFIIGIPLCVIINLINIFLIGLIIPSMVEESEQSSTFKNSNMYLSLVTSMNLEDSKILKTYGDASSTRR